MAARSKKTVENTSNESTDSRPEPVANNNGSDKQSQMATILVGLLIIASGLLIYNYFQRASAPEVSNQNQQQEQANNDNKDQDKAENDKKEEQEGQYTVVPGDSLWTIAEKVYGDGFQWKKIADANQLENNAYGEPTVSVGQVLNVPDSAATDKSPLADAGDDATNDKDQTDKENQGSTGDKSVAGVNELRQTPSTAITTHTVQAGETLWSIAEDYYADGNQWELIYQSPLNTIGKLANGQPLLHAGNVIVIPDSTL